MCQFLHINLFGYNFYTISASKHGNKYDLLVQYFFFKE